MTRKRSSAGEERGAAGIKALLVTAESVHRRTGLIRGMRVLSQANQAGGFDCPGCAWPDPDERSHAEFCENGAKAILDEATCRSIGRHFFAQHSIEELAQKSERWLNDQGRLTEPMVKLPGASHYTPLSYDEAFLLLTQGLRSAPSPDHTAFYTSGRTSNEAAFLYQLMVRAWGTNNLPDCSNLCHESSGVALKESLGIGKGTVRLLDFQRAELIFVIGQNPGTNHPRMLSALREAKLKGATIVSVNPLRERGLVRFAHPQDLSDLIDGGVKISDIFVRPHINGDQALFRGINKMLLELEPQKNSAIDRRFITQKTLGIEAYEESVRATSWSEILEKSGVEQSKILELAQLAASKKGVICTWAMGLTQHLNAVATIQEVTNFLLLTGNVGKAGAGACPVRGHSNVQGDRSVGIVPELPPLFARNMQSHLDFQLPVRPGLDTVQTIAAMNTGGVQAFVSLGGNFLSASPDTDFTRRALSKCKITAQISTKLNRSHLHTGETALIFPCLSRSERSRTNSGEQIVSVENSMGIVHASRGNLEPCHPDLLSEVSIVCRLADSLLPHDRTRSALDWRALGEDHDKIRDLISAIVPGFSNYNARLSEPGGFELENGPREGRFTTKSGRAHFISSDLSRAAPGPGELLLMTIRSHDQFNTTVYSDNDRYRGVYGSRLVLLMNEVDMKVRGLDTGDLVAITSYHRSADGSEQTRSLPELKVMAYDIPSGGVAAYFPEANPLVFLDSCAKGSRTPTSKSIRVTVESLSGASRS